MRSNAVSPPKEWPTPGAHTRFVEIDLRALTPIFKGGSTTREIDKDRPFRVPAIRGALRYWWRATSRIADVAQLRDREKELFGGVHGDGPVASAVSVAVLSQTSTPGPVPKKEKPYAFGVTGNPLAGSENYQVHRNATGTLRVEWRTDDVGDEVKRALKAWLLFGGVGGRSRRGAGSVWWSAGTELEHPKTIDDYIAAWRSLTPQGMPGRWPTLAGSAFLLGPAKESADLAWTEGLDGMRDVRASQGVRPGFNHAHRADLLEWKREDYMKFGQPRQFQSGRAALGLPIRFKGTEGEFFLNPQGANRYPSPVHMKVVKLGSGHHPVMLALRGPMPRSLSAKKSKSEVIAHGTVDESGIDRFLKLAAQLPGWERYE